MNIDMNIDKIADKIEIVDEEVCDICEEPNYPLFSWCTQDDIAYICPLCITKLDRSIPDGVRSNFTFKKITQEASKGYEHETQRNEST
jgi:hypothetical protein